MLAAVGTLVTATARPPAARASALYYVCGDNVCRFDVVKRTAKRLTRDGSSRRRYSNLSVSRDGRHFAVIYGNDLYVASSGVRNRALIDRSVVLTWVRPDGKQLAAIASRLYPLPCQFYPPPVYCPPPVLAPQLHLYAFRPRAPAQVVASKVTSAGWLGTRLMRVDDRKDGDSFRRAICLLADNRNYRCGRTVADLPGHDLSDPVGSPDRRYVAATAIALARQRPGQIVVTGSIALFDAGSGRLVRFLTRADGDSLPVFSPDGKTVAFQRGRSIFVVPTAGGRARRLIARGAHPSWAVR